MSGIQRVPSKLGEFDVFIKRISEASGFEKERMIICALRSLELETIEKG